MSLNDIAKEVGATCMNCGEGDWAANGMCLACNAVALMGGDMKTAHGRLVKLTFERDKKRAADIQQAEKIILTAVREKKMVAKTHNVDAVTSPEKLKSYVSRIENIEKEQAELSDDKKVVYAELKADGFDPKIVRAAITRRKKDPQKLAEFEDVLEVYMDAIGQLSGTPLGTASAPRTR